MKHATTVTVLLTLLLLVATDGAAQQWPKFRGVNAGNIADDPALPDTWSETENVAWKIDIPGLSWSSPVIWDDHIFVTTAISAADDEVQPIRGLYDPGEHNGAVPASGEHRWMVYDIDFETGAVRWARELHREVPTITRHLKNSYASETPVTDGERLYVYFGAIGMVAALDFDGEVLWTKDTGTFNTMQAMATASSPALHADRLYVLNDNTTRSFLTALDTATGEEIWRPVYAIQPGAAGDISVYREVASGLQEGFPGTRAYSQDDHVVWSYPLLGTYNTTALVYGDIYYTLLDRGFLTAHDAATGEEIYGRRRLEIGNGFTASPWGYNGKIFLLSEDGDTFVVKAGPEFEILHKNPLNEMTLATPAIVGDSLILRTQSKLYRIAEEGQP